MDGLLVATVVYDCRSSVEGHSAVLIGRPRRSVKRSAASAFHFHRQPQSQNFSPIERFTTAVAREVASIRLAEETLSSETKRNIPDDLISAGTLGSVARGCYSHLSDDERERTGLAKALGRSVSAIAQAIGRPKSTISPPAISCRADATRRFTPLEPINCADGMKR